MTLPQIYIFLILGLSMVMFVWGRYRHDVVALTALVAVVLLDLVSIEEAWLGFGDPAVVTVAAVLVIGRALQNAGVVDVLSKKIVPLTHNPWVHMFMLTGVVTVISAFMNNTGALALLLPVTITTCAKHGRSPSRFLMPLAFGSIIGGLMTLIGTPPNIIIAGERAKLAGREGFTMFEFAPVGVPVAIAGLMFISFIGWRLIPKRDEKIAKEDDDLFEISDYAIEVIVEEGSPLVGKPVRAVEKLSEKGGIVVTAVIKHPGKIIAPTRITQIAAGEVLLLECDPKELEEVADANNLYILSASSRVTDTDGETTLMLEALIKAGSDLIGRRPRSLRLRTGGLVRLFGVSQQGKPIQERLRNHRFKSGDVLLLKGEKEILGETMNDLGLLPLAPRNFKRGKSYMLRRSLAVFGGAVLMSCFGLSVAVTFPLAILAYIFMGVLPMKDVYRDIDWSVIVLLGCMMTVGRAMKNHEATTLIAHGILDVATGWHPGWVLAALMAVTMIISNFINNAATAAIMAPIAVGMAVTLGTDADPFLMTVAIGASSAFLTPIGHQSNTLVMQPGGYLFGDYWQMGLPLQIIVLIISIPLILLCWPL